MNFEFRISNFEFSDHTPLGLRKVQRVEEGLWNFEIGGPPCT